MAPVQDFYDESIFLKYVINLVYRVIHPYCHSPTTRSRLDLFFGFLLLQRNPIACGDKKE
jgi:hypothetical protein